MLTSARRTVAITGASGFIGSELVRHFSANGWNVLGFCRSAQKQSAAARVTFRQWSLPDGIREEDFAGGDVLVHCAWAPHSKDAHDINIRSTERLLAMSRTLGYKTFVFLSSLSAHDEAESQYGRQKRQLERTFDPARDLVLRPGLTIGNGGLARSMFDTIRTHRFVPLVGGNRPVYTIGVDELSGAIECLIERSVSGCYSLAAAEPVTLREICEGLARKAGVNRVFVPLPYLPVFLALSTAERLGLTLPVSTENLLGLKQLRRLDVAADLDALGIHPRGFAATLQSLNLS